MLSPDAFLKLRKTKLSWQEGVCWFTNTSMSQLVAFPSLS